jgi:ABC-type multidrug transport system fused ATPase/permease subunit
MFWKIYLEHTRLSDLKWTFLLAFLELVTSFVANKYITRIFGDDSWETLRLAFIASIAKSIVHDALDTLLNKASTNESLKIAASISKEQENAFLNASNPITADMPSSTIINASTDSFTTYHYTTFNIIRLFPELIDFFVVIHVATEKSWMMTQIFLFGTTIILLIQKMMDEKMEKLSEAMVIRIQQTRLLLSTRWTDILVWNRTPHDEKPPNPADSQSLTILQWREKDQYTKVSHLKINFMQGFFSLSCLLFIEKQAILIWLILNHNRLWKGVRLWRRLTEIVIHNQAKMAIHLLNYAKCRHSPKPEVNKVDLKGIIAINEIVVTQPNCPGVVLCSPLIIEPNARIILKAPKGSGKTFIISIMTGMVDVMSNMLIADTKVDFINLRLWDIFQNVASFYTENTKKTIAHPANELFPDATLSQLVLFLQMFGLEGIIPKGDNPLEIPLGRNETSLSPGTVRTIVLASRMWKLKKLLESGKVIHAVIMDEADTAIDFGTVEKCYRECIDPLLKEHGLPLIVSSHSREFCELVEKMAEGRYKVLTAHKEGDVITYQ